MLLTPDQYDSRSVAELLTEAGSGRIGFDHALIRSLLGRGSGLVAEVVAFYNEKAPATSLDLSAEIFHLLRTQRRAEALPVYVDLILNGPDDDRSEIYESLAELGEAAVAPLLAIHEEPPTAQVEKAEGLDAARMDIEFLLAGLRVRDPRIEAILLPRLESHPWDGGIYLSLYGDAGHIPALRDRLARITGTDKEADRTRHALESAISELGQHTETDEPEPFDIYEHYPETAPPVFDVLEPEEMFDFLGHPDAEVRETVLESLANEELEPGQADRVLAVAESDPSPSVRAQAWQTIAPYAAEPGPFRTKLESVLHSDLADPVERAGAAVAVSGEELTEAVASLLEKFYADPTTRALALKGMWHSFDRRFEKFFSAHIEDNDRDVQRHAIWGVGYLGLRHETGRLQQLFEADEEVRSHALFAYSLACPAEITRGRVKALFRKIEDLAGGLSEEEAELVASALDQRLAMHGLEPVFGESHQH